MDPNRTTNHLKQKLRDKRAHKLEKRERKDSRSAHDESSAEQPEPVQRGIERWETLPLYLEQPGPSEQSLQNGSSLLQEKPGPSKQTFPSEGMFSEEPDELLPIRPGIGRYGTLPVLSQQAGPSQKPLGRWDTVPLDSSRGYGRTPMGLDDSPYEAKVPVRRWTGTGREFSRATEKPAICQVCHNLKLDHEIFLDEARVVRLNLFDLAESAFEGDCRWCALIYRSMTELGAALPSPEKPGFVRILAKPRQPFSVEWVTDSRMTAEIYRDVGDPDIIKELGAAPNVAADIGKYTVFEAIRSWLKNCEQRHSSCSHAPTEAPRRLLDIGDQWGANQPVEMRLVQDINQPVRYVAFSHRWGAERHFTTTKATLSNRLQSVGWDEIPRSYKDAVIVAHELRVRYIWIDSICIVQDDIKDWEDQSVKLADIFERSYLTIAAALSPGDAHSFLTSSPEREDFLGQIIDLSDFGIRNGAVRARTIHDFRTVKTAHTLDTRAWTMQETLFPPRILTFSVLVYLECRTTSFCECGHDLFPDPFCGKVMSFDKVDRRLFNDMLRRPTKSEALEYWHKTIIPDYSRRELTQVKDRLPAVSALALRFEMKLNDRFLAGLWQENIPLQLAWSVQKIGVSVPERAPSWSWASVEGPIEWLSWFFVASSSSVSSKLKLMSVDPTAAPRLALTVRGFLCSAWLELSLVDMFAYTARLNREDRGEITFTLDPDKSPYMLDTPLKEEIATWNNESTIQRHTGEALPSAGMVCSIVRCLLLFQANNGRNLRRIFLLLTPSPRDPGTYRRIGIFSLERHESEVDAHPWYFSAEGFEEETIRIE